jgi:hypothetical protein
VIMKARLALLNLLLQLLDLLPEILDHLLKLLLQLLQRRLELLPERRCPDTRRCAHRQCRRGVRLVMASRGISRHRRDRQAGDDRRSDKKIAGTKSRLPNMSPHKMLRRNTRPASQMNR